MTKLLDRFPLLTRELSQSLRRAGRQELAEQIEAAIISRVTFDNSVNASYIYVEPSRILNAVETNIIGVRHGETIEVETRFWTNIDTDNFGRLIGVEILDPAEIKSELRNDAVG